MRFLPEAKFGARRRANHRKNAPVRRRNYQIVPGRRRASRIAKERSNPEHEQQSHPAGPWHESKQERVGERGDGDERPPGPMNDRLFQIVTCVPISTTRLGGKR